MFPKTLVLGAVLAAALAACGGAREESAARPEPTRLLAQVTSVAAPVTLAGNLSQYTIAATATGFSVTDNLGGATQEVGSRARLRFADTAVAFDFDGNPGQAYRMYQAAFNRKPDLGGLGFQLNALDAGFSLLQISQNFIDSPEFSATYGALNTVDFVTLLYANVLRRLPDAGGLAFYASHLDGTNPDGLRFSRADVLKGFSESPENKALVLGAIAKGIEYTPFGSVAPSEPPGDFAGAYSGTFRGDDAGTLSLTVGADGAIAASGRSNTFGADLAGAGSLAAGGKFTVTLTGAGRTSTFTGSINKAARLATGSWAFAGSASAGVFNASLPAQASFSQVQAIIVQRCVPCHSTRPTIPGFNPAPLGIRYDTEAQIRADVARINANAVQSQTMPYGNFTSMTEAERVLIGQWIQAGTP